MRSLAVVLSSRSLWSKPTRQTRVRADVAALVLPRSLHPRLSMRRLSSSLFSPSALPPSMLRDSAPKSMSLRVQSSARRSGKRVEEMHSTILGSCWKLMPLEIATGGRGGGGGGEGGGGEGRGGEGEEEGGTGSRSSAASVPSSSSPDSSRGRKFLSHMSSGSLAALLHAAESKPLHSGEERNATAVRSASAAGITSSSNALAAASMRSSNGVGGRVATTTATSTATTASGKGLGRSRLCARATAESQPTAMTTLVACCISARIFSRT